MSSIVSAQQLNASSDAQMRLRSGKQIGVAPYGFSIDRINEYNLENQQNMNGMVLRSGNVMNNTDDSYVLLRSGRLVGKELYNDEYTRENTMTLRSGRLVNANAYTDAYVVMNN
jgi:predicted solute-binding protein